MSSTLDRLKTETARFFDRHWSESTCGHPPPRWSDRWQFVGEIPNHNLQGVYALLRGDTVLYVGSGASRNGGAYTGHGLGARLSRYWKVDPDGARAGLEDRQYVYAGNLSDPAPESIVTLPLKHPYGYLAPSVEAFLIVQLRPVHNKVIIGTTE